MPQSKVQKRRDAANTALSCGNKIVVLMTVLLSEYTDYISDQIKDENKLIELYRDIVSFTNNPNVISPALVTFVNADISNSEIIQKMVALTMIIQTQHITNSQIKNIMADL